MLRLNVGFCKKIGEANYGSRGASANLEVEVETSLIDNPAEIHERIRRLYRLARQSVDEELAGEQPQQNGHVSRVMRSGRAGDHTGNGNKPQSHARPATQSQVRAIYAIATRQQLDLAQELNSRYGVPRPHDLTIRDASTFIDAIKPQVHNSGNGARR